MTFLAKQLSGATVGAIQQGLTWNFDGASQADANPGAAKFRANNATPSSATQLFIHSLALGTVSHNAFLQAQQAPGFLYIEQRDDSTRWALFDITALTVVGAGYLKLQVAINGASPSAEIQDGKDISFAFLEGPHQEAHTIASHSDTTATGAELETLTDGSLADSLHDHDHDVLTGFEIGEHRVINDSGTSTTELFSASKIDSALSAIIAGVDIKGGVDTATTRLGNTTLSGEPTPHG